MAFQPSDEQRSAAMEHIRYEINQLAWLYHLRSVPLGQLLGNAVVETTVIHLSILRDFFESPLAGRHQDDVLAEDFGFKASPLGIDRATIERRNKEVAHLTYVRTEKTLETRGWRFDDLVPPVLQRASEFVQHILLSCYVDESAERDKWADVARLLGGFRSIQLQVGAARTTEAAMHDMSFSPAVISIPKLRNT